MFKRTLLLVCILSVSANTQQIASSQQNSSTGAIQGLSARLTINVTNVPLRMALDEVVKLSGVRIDYSRTVVPMERRVSVHGKDITLAAALKQALEGTGTEARAVEEGGVVITRSSAKGSLKAQGVISGTVTDAKSGKWLSGASVSVNNDSRSVTTDEKGFYRIGSVGAGNHTVAVRSVGYAKQTRQVTVGEGATVTADFKLEPSANVLDQVVVTGTVIASELRSVPNAITVITAKQIEERGITRIDQLFRGEIPGLFSLNLGSNALLDEVMMFSRGATALADGSGTSPSAGTTNGTNPIKTYIDGVEMADSKYLSQIDPASIERIEILTGPQASTIYGSNAINGVMQIFTKRGTASRPQVALNFTGGVAQNNFNSHVAPSYVTDASVSGMEGRLSYRAGGSWDYLGSWTPSKQTQRFGANAGGRTELGKLTADLSARQVLTRNKQRGSQDQGSLSFYSTGAWRPITLTRVSQNQTLNGSTAGLTLSFRPLSTWSHELVLGADASTVDAAKLAPGFSSRTDSALSISKSVTSRTSSRYTTSLQLTPTSFTNLNLTFGGEHWLARGSSWSANPVALTGSLSSPTVTRNKPEKNAGAFMQGQLGLREALFFTYGIRADWNPNFGDEAKVKPGRYGVSYTRDIGAVSAKLRGSYGRSIRPPAAQLKLSIANTIYPEDQFGIFDTQLANPYLGPEHQQGGEGGIELYLGHRGSLVVTRYNQTVDNLIFSIYPVDSVISVSPATISTGCSSAFLDATGRCFQYQNQYLNVGSIRNQGWELQGSLNLGPLSTRGTYSWTKSRVLGITPRYRSLLSGSQFEPGRPFNYLPEHTWALAMSYAHAASSVSLFVNGISTLYRGFGADPLLSATDAASTRFSTRQPRFRLPDAYRAVGPGYATADLNATHRFSANIDALLQIVNLADYYQNDRDSRLASIGRVSKLGIRMRLQ